MTEYHKIEAVFEREMSGSRKLIPGKFFNETVEYLKDNQWIFTEKIDGTNTRIHWDGHRVEFGGRTDDSQIQGKLVDYLIRTFKENSAEELFEQKFGGTDVILFGEGYGPGIQNGHLYRNNAGFILFDVMVDSIYLKRDSVEDIAQAFGIDVVPIVLTGTIDEAIALVKSNPPSTIENAKMEGVVGRPAVEMFDRMGHRVITKIKCRDFKGV